MQIENKTYKNIPESVNTSVKCNNKSPQFDLKTFMRSGEEYQKKTFGVTLSSILRKVQERHLVDMKDSDFSWLKDEVRHASHSRKSWADAVDCDRETAMKHEYNGYTYGELGTTYFYFQHKKNKTFSDDEIEHLHAYTPCCYMKGQCCLFNLGGEDEDDYDGDPCECCMGRDNGSYSFYFGHNFIGEDTLEEENQLGLI